MSRFPLPTEATDACTICYANDRYPATFHQFLGRPRREVYVYENRIVTIDTKGSYLLFDNKDIENRRIFTYRKNGKCVEKGQPMRRGVYLVFGKREYYRCPEI